MNAPGVYAIVNGSTERTYIGISTNMRSRWHTHRSALRKGTHHAPELQRDWNFYGERMFAFVPLEVVHDFKKRIEREQVHLNAAHHAYNVSTIAGPGPKPGIKRSPETIERLRLALLGKRKSPEHCLNISKAKRGKKNPVLSAKMRGIPRPAMTEKARLVNTGRALSESTKAKLRAAHLGKKFTAEHCLHISQAKRGVKLGPRKQAVAIEQKASPSEQRDIK